MEATIAKRVLFLAFAGCVVGLVVLGLGGRILMRLLSFITPEPPRFTLSGTLQIMVAGAAWGGVTAPLLIILARWRSRVAGAFGMLFGLVVMTPALILFVQFSGFSGGIVAPPLFIAGTVVLFPLLFIVHGTILERITRARVLLWRDQERHIIG